MIRTNPREFFQRAFARMWPDRNLPDELLPNGVDRTDRRAAIRDNIRGQRATIEYHRRGQ